ncbi:DsbA family protein [Zhongshania sp. BJYM1]|uniref:DsbA family protein n=1 Tax=Zhongshania aquatica TaxID=2965069 RepID=UPI0022B34100|nr:thioredoxin domain-containing protein [Marortus sp. BJYM1]
MNVSKFLHTATLVALGLLGTQVYFQNGRILALEQAPSMEETIRSAITQARKDEYRQRAKDRLSGLRDAAKSAPEYSEDGLLYGPADARFSIAVFTDIECPYCRQMHGEVKRVVDSSNDNVNWKIIHFPLSIHNPAAAIEAQVLECVKESYGNRTAWAFLDAMIAGTAGNGKGIENLPEFGSAMGLSSQVIKNCLASDSNKEKINSDFQRGVVAGITGTPAMLITDNSSGKSSLVRQMQNAQSIAQEIQKLIQQ